MKMLCGFGRRRFRNRFVAFLTTIVICSIISFILGSNPKIITNARNITNIEKLGSRLFCVLVHTKPTHEKFLNFTDITWTKGCHKIIVVRHKQLPTSDNDLHPAQNPYHIDLWKHILASIRQSVRFYELISTKDSMVIVPPSTFVFREKLVSLFETSTKNAESPFIIIYEQTDAHAYILNGPALHHIRNTKLIDSCLQQSYPGARETYLWKCVKTKLRDQQKDSICENNQCFIQYHRNPLTITDIKNGFCLQSNFRECQSITLLYPVTFSDMIMLDFFKYRLKPKP
ncbi:unnamed protein product [Rotaria magnacalcarata]|uniref:Uncharacterized protein n=2 Tax=Rotaria magnacalcarata TaxID=392030 RepID=A0A816QDM3_9BILA|nr:unnamed protein product [Rotaria magnacalcarata]